MAFHPVRGVGVLLQHPLEIEQKKKRPRFRGAT